MGKGDVLVRLENVVKHFPIKGGVFLRQVDSVKAVNGVSFEIREGETFGLVGESGCGKSTLGNVILGLEKPTSGRIYYDQQDINALRGAKRRSIRHQMQIVFQDPFESLNPRMTVEEIVGEGLRIQGGMSKKEIHTRVIHMLQRVGLNAEHALRYPHEFSGGQRQRIGIARALIVQPRFIVCDEPVSALDVSVQAQIINLLRSLQREFGYTYLFVAHGLNVVRHMSDRVGVMYLGQLVEVADADEIFAYPRHPYTQALISAIPDVGMRGKPFESALSGDVPSPVNLPSGCPFHPRCPYAKDICRMQMPDTHMVGRAQVMCHLYDDESIH
ncbi:MAG: ABC transporter ATP-binding protein [Clostridia bacterium]|nr:ABC transporter ATP-binding protein [Clostridia bacterium]